QGNEQAEKKGRVGVIRHFKDGQWLGIDRRGTDRLAAFGKQKTFREIGTPYAFVQPILPQRMAACHSRNHGKVIGGWWRRGCPLQRCRIPWIRTGEGSA